MLAFMVLPDTATRCGLSHGTANLHSKGWLTIGLVLLLIRTYGCVVPVHSASSAGLQTLSADHWPKDAWPVLGVAVNAKEGCMHVCWALAQKSQQQGIHYNKRKQYTLYDILDRVEPSGHACSDAILHPAYSKGTPGTYKWHQAFMEGKGPKISKENGNKFFPYIKVSSSGKMFKVYYTLWHVLFF